MNKKASDPIRALGLHDLVEVVQHHARQRPEQEALTFLAEGGAPERTLSYGALAQRTMELGGALRERLGEGARALLLFAPGLEFVEAFYGCLAAGVVAVPVYPPDPARLDRTLPRLQSIAGDAGATAVLTSSALLPMVQGLSALAPEFAGVQWIATDALTGDGASWARRPAAADALAYLQYTSGSTGQPKGVMISHGNLMANSAQIRAGFNHDDGLVGVGWLPTYHDMGLVGKVLQTTYVGTHTALMSPIAFLKRPLRWLEAITRFGGTTSGGPNFAYDLCTRKITDAELAQLDLSSWRVAFCGAEPVRAGSLDRFAERFAPCGFKREALYPCYGLAEATLYVSGGWIGSSARALEVDAEALKNHVLTAAPSPEEAATLVGCGPVSAEQAVAIVDPERLVSAPEGGIGEIWVHGPNVALGYWRQPEATEATFGAQLPGDDRRWLRTGDLGAVVDGQLVITGRLKDLIILHGRNHYPQDIEATAEQAHPWVREGCVAACAVERSGAERLILIAEVNLPPGGGDLGAVIDALRAAVAERHEVATQRIALIPARAIPKTSSGKLQRGDAKRALLAGELHPLLDWEAGAPATSALYNLNTDRFQRLEERNTRYRFNLDEDVRWGDTDAPGEYFTRETLEFAGIDVDLLRADPEVWDTFQWALAVGICEEFVRLETRILDFMDAEAKNGNLPPSRSADLFQEEEVKHVALFQRYGDALRAQRPALARRLDAHINASFHQAWWHDDQASNYPSVGVYHFVTWLHFLFFEEYSIYLHDAMLHDPAMQPAWVTAHAAHRREEQQHVVTDQAYAEALLLNDEDRRRWSLWFLERCGADSSGLAGLEGVWTFCVDTFPQLQSLALTRQRLNSDLARQRAFARLLKHKRAFARTCRAATGFDDFHDRAEHEAARRAQSMLREAPPVSADVEGSVASWLAAALAERTGDDPNTLDHQRPFPYFGLDSIAVVSLSADLETWLRETWSWREELSPALLYEHYTVQLLARKLASLISSAESTPAQQPAAAAAAERVELDPSIFGDADTLRDEAPDQHVLVTGTTGFLMGYVLAELLKKPGLQAHCLVRASTPDQARTRIEDNLRAAGLWSPALALRIHPLPGDLASPLLGLTQDTFDALAAQIEEIYHGGAIVDFVQPYDLLKPTNVQGTQEIIRLAHKGRVRALNLVSTIAVFDTHDQQGIHTAHEADLPDGHQGFRNGYAQSKWAAERIARMAQERGLPLRIFRPGIVSGHTRTGHWQIDMVAAMLKGYAHMRAAILPVAGGNLNAAPVDYVAQAIVHIAQQPRTLGQTFHLTNPEPTPWSQIYTWMQRLGYAVEPIPYDRWLQRLEDVARQGDASVQAYLQYFKARPLAWQLRQPPFDTRNTRDALLGSTVACPPLSPDLFGLYLRRFQDIGFIQPPPPAPSEALQAR